MGRKSKGRTKTKAKPESVKKLILDVYHQAPQRVYNYKQMSRRISLNTAKGKSQVLVAMQDLLEDGALIEEDKGRYKLNFTPQVEEGIIDFTTKGTAFVIIEGFTQDVFIGKKNTGKALHGDLVKVRVLPDGKKRFKGEVQEVVERKKKEYVGSIQRMERFAFFRPDDPKVSVDFFVPMEKLKDAKNRQKVVVRIMNWPDTAASPFAEVTEILGFPGENDTEMQSILTDYGFPLDFPDKVKNDAASIPMEIPAEEISKREDFRGITTFTIDPVDAKDFDDAISIRKLENGRTEIGVHIADVTHYVTPKSDLEKEARKRATSVYLVDRVIPMLPEELSNVVCSLRPNEDKLTYACIFEMDDKAQIKKYRIGRTVIHSDRRFTYEEVQEILEGKDGDYSDELRLLNDFAKKLREGRMKSGSIAFDKVEVRFDLDEEKKPVGVNFKIQKDAHKLIEEFMLLANRTVSAHVAQPKKKGQVPKPFVFRIHDHPDPEKLAVFSDFIKRFGYNYKFSKGNVAENLNGLLQEVKGKREENVIENLAIRTMAKAIYSTDNIGHYGLNFDYYSHFTSPIRRYPDMMVHRLLTQYAETKTKPDVDALEEQCEHSSEMEQKAVNAERDSTKYFQVLYMQETEGEEFDGFVSGMSEWGIYVELEDSKCEGMVRLRELQGDYFFFDEKNFQVVGHNTGVVINLGAKLRIKVLEADLVRRRLDFSLVEVLEN